MVRVLGALQLACRELHTLALPNSTPPPAAIAACPAAPLTPLPRRIIAWHQLRRCGHCKQLAPAWRAAAKSLKGVVRVGAVNCDEHQELCSQHGVKGFPTIKSFVPGQQGGRDYQGGRSAKAIADWALGLVPSAVVSLGNGQALDEFLASCQGKGKARDRAAWAACAVLITDKSTTSPLWKALSTVYKGKVAFGEVRSKHADVVAALVGSAGVQLPALVTVCNGDLQLAEVFKGKLKSEALSSHLSSYAGGRKCSKAIKLTADTDFSKLSAGQLKQLAREQGVQCAGCTEKGDFVAALKAHVVSSS